MLQPKDYVQPKKMIYCLVTETSGRLKKSYSRTVEVHEIFRVFTCTWTDYKNDYHIVLFAPLINNSLVLIEGYARDFQKVTNEKQLNMLKLLYG